MKRFVVCALLALLVFVSQGDSSTSAHSWSYGHYLGSPNLHSPRASIIDLDDSFMQCPYNSGWRSILYVSIQWNDIVFAPNGNVPYFLTSGTCTVQYSNTARIEFEDWGQNCVDILNCVNGFTYTEGQDSSGAYGACGPTHPCIYITRAIVKINNQDNWLAVRDGGTPPNAATRQTAIHELGHPLGLADVPLSVPCDLNARSIMWAHCLLYHYQITPGPHDVSDVGIMY